MPDIAVTVTISDENIERVCPAFLRLWAMPQENGEDKYVEIQDWIAVKLEEYLLQIVNRGLTLLATDDVEQITDI